MTSEFGEWVKEKVELIDSKTQYYPHQEKINVKARFLKKLIEEVMPNVTDAEIKQLLKEEIDSVVALLPVKKEASERVKYRDYLIKVQNLKKTVKIKLDLVEEGQYKALGITFGLMFGAAFGPIVGLFTGNVALGVGIGLPIGMALGTIMGFSYETKAKKQNKVI